MPPYTICGFLFSPQVLPGFHSCIKKILYVQVIVSSLMYIVSSLIDQLWTLCTLKRREKVIIQQHYCGFIPFRWFEWNYSIHSLSEHCSSVGMSKSLARSHPYPSQPGLKGRKRMDCKESVRLNRNPILHDLSSSILSILGLSVTRFRFVLCPLSVDRKINGVNKIQLKIEWDERECEWFDLKWMRKEEGISITLTQINGMK